MLKDINASVKIKSSPFEIPDGVELMAEASANPELVIKVDFLDEVSAKRFENQWKNDLPKFIDEKVPFIARGMVRGFYEDTSFALDGKVITLRSKFSESQASLMLDQIAAGSRKMLRRTPEQIEAARLRREEWWKLRQNGKLTPSEALEKQNSKAKPGPKPKPKPSRRPAGKP